MDREPIKENKPLPWLLIVFLALSLSTASFLVEKLLLMLGASIPAIEVIRLAVSLTLWILVILFLIKKFGPQT